MGRHFKKGDNQCYKGNCREAPQEITPESNGAASAPLVLQYWSQAARARRHVAELPPKFLLHEPSNHQVSETVSPCFLQSGLSEYRKDVGTTLHFMIRPCKEFFNVLSFPLPLSLSLSPSLTPSFFLPPCLSLCLAHGVRIIPPEYLYSWMLQFDFIMALNLKGWKKKQHSVMTSLIYH